MITVVLNQGEVDAVFGALDQMACEFGLYVKQVDECDCPLFSHGHSQNHTVHCRDKQLTRGDVLLEKFRSLASEGA